MIRLLILSLLTSPICSRPGYRSSVMYGETPILRLGPDESENSDTPPKELKEPQWVSNLRTNIQKQINEAGFENAKPDIKGLIEEATGGSNSGRSNSEEDSPEVQVQDKSPLRSGSQSRNAEWENDLKDYIKELIGTYGSKQLESYVKPVIKSIERAQNVVIKDIDVNPYGKVAVNYERVGQKSNSNFPNPSFFKREGILDDEQFGHRYTMAPE